MNISSLADGATITQLDLTPCASRNSGGGGSSTLKVFYRFDGVDGSDAGSYALSGTTPVGLSTTSIGGLSLDKGTASNLQIGAVYSSGTKGARLGRLAVVATYVTLTAPSGLSATSTGTGGAAVTVNWSDNSTNEDGFKVERSTNSASGPWSEVGTTGTNDHDYVDGAVSFDQTYYYRVRAYNGGGNSGYSNSAYAVTYQNSPTAPSSLSAAGTGSTVVLNWTDNSTNEDTFRVERSNQEASGFAEIGSGVLNITSFTDNGAGTGTVYYRVRARNVVGDSGYSNTAVR